MNALTVCVRVRGCLVALLLGVILLVSIVGPPGAVAQVAQSYQELFEHSQKEKKGLMFYVKGQTIAGVVIRLIGNEGVEVRNQTYGRIIIRLDSIDAVAMN